MTSGHFTSFSVPEITLNRANRQRRELTNIDDLAESISRIGLINPLVITRAGELVTGERRLTAVRQLGWTHVPVQFADELDEYQLHVIELEENVKRVDLTWQDQCAAVLRYHELRAAHDPEWTMHKSADELGFSSNAVYQRIAVARELANGNERVAQAGAFRTARNIIQRKNERERASVLAAPEEAAAPTAPLLLADFTEWQRSYGGPKFNFIHCDFPYAAGGFNGQTSARSFGSYVDDADTYAQLLESLDNAMTNVVAESAHLIFWFSMNQYEDTIHWLSSMGWSIDPFPLIWYKSDNSGILPDAERGPRRIYEAAFFGSRGDRKIVQAFGNVSAHPVVKTIHMSEKPRGMLRHFFRMIVDEYSLVLDPTCGSGNALRVASELGASSVLGLEKNQEFYENAVSAYFTD